MLAYLEAAGLLTDRVSSAWHLSPPAPQQRSRGVRKGAVSRLLRRAAAALRQARQRHRLIRDLSGRSDHLLADIGITRAEIPAFAAAAVAGVDPRQRTPSGAPRQVRPVATPSSANDNLTEIAA